MEHSGSLFLQFGQIDIYLFDQIMKGRFDSVKSVLDVGCGHGRNLSFFLRNGFDVFGIDQDKRSILLLQRMAAGLAPHLPPDNFVTGDISDLPYESDCFDSVLSNAVLHFADNERHFDQMVDEIWRVIKPGGLFFCRLASSIGLESAKAIGNGRFLLPDGSERFLVDEEKILNTTRRLSGKLLDPLKTTIVQNMRCMTTWCLRKNSELNMNFF